MKPKKFSLTLIEIRKVLELEPGEMALILGISQEMYRRYEAGRFDKAKESRYKENINIKIATLEIEIEKKILALKSAQYKFQMSTYFNTVRGDMLRRRLEAEKKYVKKNVTKNGSNHTNLVQKTHK